MEMMPSSSLHFSRPEKELNFKPYVNQSTGRVNTELQQSNPLFQPTVEVNPDDAFKIISSNKKWG